MNDEPDTYVMPALFVTTMFVVLLELLAGLLSSLPKAPLPVAPVKVQREEPAQQSTPVPKQNLSIKRLC